MTPPLRSWLAPEGSSSGRRRRVVVALVAVALVIVALAGSVLITSSRVFESRTTVAIDQVPGIAASDGPAVIEKLARLRLKYVGLLSTDVFSRPVSGSLDLPHGRVAAALFSHAPASSLLMFVGGRDADPMVAREVATAAANELIAYVEAEQDAASIPPDRRFAFTIVSPASEPVLIDRPIRRAAAVGVGLMMITGLAAGAWWLARIRP